MNGAMRWSRVSSRRRWERGTSSRFTWAAAWGSIARSPIAALGDGVPCAVYGDDLHEGQAEFTRPILDTLLGSEWLPSIPDVHERLESDPPARVTDVACGQGFSSIAIARAYPKVHVDGIDSDEPSIAAAERNLKGSGVEDRMLHCLPVGMVGEGAAGTGTVMRAATVRRYADEAGFQGFEVPIENDFYRFYRLEP